MADRRYDTVPLDDPEATLERAFIEEHLHARGYDSASLPPDLAKQLLADACAYAAAKLAEVAARAHYVHELHGDA